MQLPTMCRMECLLMMLALLVVSSWAVPTEKKQRTMEKSLSDMDHEDHGEHNPDYDHDAFLGHEDRKTFDQLSPDESKERLAIIVRKIDKNSDGFVSEDELQKWIQYVQKRYIINDTDRMWKDHNPDENNILSWSAYQKRTFGYDDDPNVKGSKTEAYVDMINRDRRRWDKADKSRDDRLSKEEFMDFLHPEDAEHMREIVVMETIEDIDKDKDGLIDLEEYIADIWGDDDDDDDDDEDDDDKDEHGEPDWVTSERDQFRQFRDRNGDGKLDTNEVRDWIIPQDYDHSSAEAKHLMADSDIDKDGQLTHQEILDKYDLFVGSQATDFGEALTQHDEF